MKRPSLFQIGLILSVIGVFWIGFVFYDGEKISQNFYLNFEQTKSFDLKLQNSGIGFYKISVPNLGDFVFIQIIDSDGNIITDKKIGTKTAVNYFDFVNSGVYTVKITNISEHPILVDLEFGNTNVSEIRIPGSLLFFGVMLMIISTYFKLKNYKSAQPDENIS